MNRFALAAAIAAFAATPLAAFDVQSMNDAEREAFRAEVRAYLMDNPEVLLEAIEVLESRQAEQQAANDVALVNSNADALFNDGYSFVGGNPEGDITVVEFLDYKCGYCRRAHPDVNELVSTDGNIRYVIKEFPILGEESLLAARFALAVKEIEGDEAYFETHNELMTMREPVTAQSLSELSELMGYDTPAVFDAMNGDEIERIINENRALAQTLNINGTPSFIFETEMVRGYLPLDAMRQVVEEVRREEG